MVRLKWVEEEFAAKRKKTQAPQRGGLRNSIETRGMVPVVRNEKKTWEMQAKGG